MGKSSVQRGFKWSIQTRVNIIYTIIQNLEVVD